MHSTVVKRSVVVDGHKTSVSLEDEFWKALKEIAAARSATLSDLVAMIDHRREQGNLSSSLRLFVLESFQQRAVQGQGDHLGVPSCRKGRIRPERRRSVTRPHIIASAAVTAAIVSSDADSSAIADRTIPRRENKQTHSSDSETCAASVSRVQRRTSIVLSCIDPSSVLVSADIAPMTVSRTVAHFTLDDDFLSASATSDPRTD